jgi:hypothetical protein
MTWLSRITGAKLIIVILQLPRYDDAARLQLAP